MYCNHCHKYISDSSKRYCDYCGAYLGSKNIMTTPARNATSMDLPRGDVVNYLYIVKSLECIRSEMKLRISENLRNIEAYRQPVYLPEIKAEKDGDVSSLTIPSTSYFSYVDWKLAGRSLVAAGGTFAVLMILCFIFFIFVMIFAKGNDLLCSDIFEDTLFYSVIAISVGVLVVGWSLSFLILPPDERNYAIKNYNKGIKLNEEILMKYKSDSAAREAKIRQIEKENELKAQQEEYELKKNNAILSDIENQLSSVYSLNIIPSQYRTLEAAIYIYDFMATSRETLKDTLFHLDFKNISEHMRSVNRQLIANEAILKSMNGSLSDLYCQNKEIQKAVEAFNYILSGIKPFDK